MSIEIPSSLALGRYKRIAQRSDETWQGGLVKFPAWIDDPASPDAEPYRPMAAVWVSLRTGRLHTTLSPTGRSAPPSLLVDALLEFAAREAKGPAGCRPWRLEVRDQALRHVLEEALAGTGTSVAVVPDTPAVRDALASFADYESEGTEPPGALDARGVTLDRLRSFATGAAAFYEARPWEHLINEDLIVVDAPTAPKGMSHLSVLGNGGEQFGIAFFESRRAFEAVLDGKLPRRAHGVTFCAADEMPFPDLDLWDEHGLPPAAPDAYPVAADIRLGKPTRRPDAEQLAFTEALLRALAATSQDQLDSGRWDITVETASGSIALTLALPYLLEGEAGLRPAAVRPAMARGLAERQGAQITRFLEQRQFATIEDANVALDELGTESLTRATSEALAGRPLTQLEQAQELAYDAMETEGRLKVKLARRALALSEDCADAWSILGDEAPSAAAALDAYERGIEAGTRAIGGPTQIAELAGSFWSDISTRPYMRAMLSAAEALWRLDRREEALGHYRELLHLNPNDNQGARYVLLPALLQLGKDEEASVLLDRYKDDIQAIWPFGRTLWLFRTTGDSHATRASLDTARAVNRHVTRLLLAPETIPVDDPPHVTLGSLDEAAYAVRELLPAFEGTPGALAWLRTRAPRQRRGTRGR